MKENITVSTGKVVAIGKLKVFSTKAFSHTIPELSFLVALSKDGLFTATCFPLLIDVTTTDEMSAVKSLEKSCAESLVRLFEDTRCDAWEQLHELSESPIGEEFATAYRHVRLNLAERGVDMKSSRERYLENKIEELKKELSLLKGSKQTIDVDVVNYERAA